jgi:hypothetical protein
MSDTDFNTKTNTRTSKTASDLSSLVDHLVELNVTGQVLTLCKTYFAENILMLSDGNVFATSMQEAHDKQKGFVEAVKKFEVTLIEKKCSGNRAELTFRYKMTGADDAITEFVGQHIQTWLDGKIVKEEYLSIQ